MPQLPIPPDAPRADQDRALVGWIIASQLAPPLMFSGVAVTLPAMGADLRVGATTLGLIETLFLAGNLGLLLAIGRLADAGDKRTLYKLGLLCFGLSSLLIGVLSWTPAILAIRFLQGVSGAVFATTGMALLSDIVPPERRGRVFGASIGTVYAGLCLGPILAGLLLESFGWRSVFLAGGSALLTSAIVIHLRMPSRWRVRLDAVHLPSAIIMATAVLCLVAGSASVRHGLAGCSLLAASVALGVTFAVLQLRIPKPLLDVDLLRHNAVLRSALSIQLLLYMTAFSSIFLLSIYLQVALGHPARTAGLVLAIGSVLMAIAAPFTGLLAEQFRPRTVADVGALLVLASTVLALGLDRGSGLLHVVTVLSVQGVGYALFVSPNTTIVMNSVAATSAGMASALAAKSRTLGMVAGMVLTAVLISFEIGDEPIERHPDALVRVMATTFAALTVLTLGALLVSLASRRRRRPPA